MRFFRTIQYVVAATVTVGGLLAQVNSGGPPVPAPTTKVTAPVLGYFIDHDGAQLKSIVGIPRSSFQRAGSDTGSEAVTIEIAPSQDYALAILTDSGRLAAIQLDTDTQTPTLVAGAMSAISRISISPAGAAAILYSETSRRAQVFTGFPGSPVLAHEFDWSALSGSVAATAVDDAGDLALVAAQSDNSVLFAISSASAPAEIYRAQTISGVTFLRNSREALVTAPAENQVIWVQDHAGVPVPVTLADGSAGVAAPQAVAASEDGGRGFVLNAAGGILAIPLSGARATRVSCACQPSQLQRMRGRDVFLLTGSPQSQLVLVDAGNDAIDVVLLPSEPQRSAQVAGGKKQ